MNHSRADNGHQPGRRQPTPGGVVTTPARIGCSYSDCQQTARGRVAAPVLLDPSLGGQHGFVIIRPVGTRLTKGAPYCVDHIHYAVDLTLLAADAP